MHLNLLRQFRLGAANREPLCLHDYGHFQSESFCLWADRQIRCQGCIQRSRRTARHGNVQAGQHYAWDSNAERRHGDGISRKAAGWDAYDHGDAYRRCKVSQEFEDRQPDGEVGDDQPP
jgi:hypothetical protein